MVLSRMVFHDRQLTTESQHVAGAHLDDLDLALVQRHIAAAYERSRLSQILDPLVFLRRYHGVIERNGELLPTLAGLLTFANEPERWIDAAGVDVAEFKGSQSRSTDIRFIEQVRGPLFAVIDRVAQILWDRSEHGYGIVGTQREEEHAYPQIVLRELTVNALCHRDWSQAGSRVRVHLHPSNLTWISPGELPSSIRIEELLEVQFSRNPSLVTLLFQAGYIEGLGLGLDTVFDALRQTGRPAPVMRSAAHSFSITVAALPIRRATQVTTSPAERQQAILGLVTQHGPLSISMLEERLTFNRRTIQRDLHTLVEGGLLVVTGVTNDRRYSRADVAARAAGASRDNL